MEQTAPKQSGNLALYKPGQAKAARWSAYLLGSLLAFFGVLSLYGTINVPGSQVYVENLPVVGSITLYKIIAVCVFVLAVYALHLILNRPTMVDLLIDTEQELKKVSWPSRLEVKNATLVVALVTFVMGFILYWADELLQHLLRFVF
jgi:preprotein translocase subunit SecE